jgi:acetyltransferase-like isoleucine patch superfamily enzyme
MIIANNKKHIGIVGYEQAVVTKEIHWWISEEFDGEVSIINPTTLEPEKDVAYIVSITRSFEERKSAIDKLKGYSTATFIHNTATLHGDNTIRGGCVISPYCSVYSDTVLCGHNMLAPYSMVSHNTVMGVGSILHPYTLIAGSCDIGNYCLFNIRSTVIDKITICDNVVVGAGSMITKDIQIPGFYVGIPARKSA